MGKFSQSRSGKEPQNKPETAKELLSDLPNEIDIEPVPDSLGSDMSEARYVPIQEANSSVKKNRKIMIISICSVIAALLIGLIATLVYVFAIDPNDGKILNNVSVGGVNVGNMTRSEAKAALRAATKNTYTQQDMVIVFPDAQIYLSPADTGVALDINAAIDAAYDYGRVGTKEENAQALAASMNAEHPIALLPYLNLNLEYIRQEIESYVKSFNSVYEASSVVHDGEMPILDANAEGFDPEAAGQNLVIKMGMPGRYVDVEKAYAKVLDAYSFNQFQVVVNMDEEETIPEEIDLEKIIAEYCTAPQDAVVDPETYEVTMEIYGYTFDIDKAAELLENSRYGDTLTLPMSLVVPEVLGGPFRDTYFRDILSEYQTKHTKSEARNTNLNLACEAINGLILDPGEVFDYNTVVGKRTAEKGYQFAPAYSDGKVVMDIGGGVCQVSSTLYYCCLISDLEIINRQPHSYIATYMPAGMDATVNWGGPDFTFRNSTNYPIRIEMWVADGYVHCKLIGTDEKDYYVEMEYEILAYDTAGSIVEVYPPDNPEGYKNGEVIQTAYNGCTVQTYKVKYDKETKEMISREEEARSKYKKRDKITVSIKKPQAESDDSKKPKE